MPRNLDRRESSDHQHPPDAMSIPTLPPLPGIDLQEVHEASDRPDEPDGCPEIVDAHHPLLGPFTPRPNPAFEGILHSLTSPTGMEATCGRRGCHVRNHVQSGATAMASTPPRDHRFEILSQGKTVTRVAGSDGGFVDHRHPQSELESGSCVVYCEVRHEVQQRGRISRRTYKRVVFRGSLAAVFYNFRLFAWRQIFGDNRR